MIYLDNNATTKIDNIVLEEMMPFLQDEYANASSMYEFARKPSGALKTARIQVRDFVGARDEKEIIVPVDVLSAVVQYEHSGFWCRKRGIPLLCNSQSDR